MKRVALFVLVLVVAVAAGGVVRAEDTFRDGLRAYNVRDYRTAYAIWSRLADNDDPKSQASLGYMYYSGQGVPQSSRYAADWFYRAANQGESTAQSYLSLMHFYADGVSHSLELALMWCELALASGNILAMEWRQGIIERMTPAQQENAWRLIAEWYRIHDKAAAN